MSWCKALVHGRSAIDMVMFPALEEAAKEVGPPNRC